MCPFLQLWIGPCLGVSRQIGHSIHSSCSAFRFLNKATVNIMMRSNNTKIRFGNSTAEFVPRSIQQSDDDIPSRFNTDHKLRI